MRGTSISKQRAGQDSTQDSRFSQQCCWRFKSSEMYRCVLEHVVPRVLKNTVPSSSCSSSQYLLRLLHDYNCWTLKTEALQSFKQLGTTSQTTRCHTSARLQSAATQYAVFWKTQTLYINWFLCSLTGQDKLSSEVKDLVHQCLHIKTQISFTFPLQFCIWVYLRHVRCYMRDSWMLQV